MRIRRKRKDVYRKDRETYKKHSDAVYTIYSIPTEIRTPDIIINLSPKVYIPLILPLYLPSMPTSV